MAFSGHHSEEAKAKMSAANTNPSLETRARMSKAQKGRITSPETRVKLSVTSSAMWARPEIREKISTAMMGHPNWNVGPVPEEVRERISAALWKGGPQVTARKKGAKRRSLGFAPLNSWFEGSNAHHLSDGVTVIYMPRSMHSGKGKYHNHYTGQGMAEMDALAERYLAEAFLQEA